MIVYRIGHSKYAHTLDGEGAKINGGRWNEIGVPCIYTSESRALALLEYTCHAKRHLIPRDLSFTTFEVPDHSIELITTAKLPGNWKKSPNPKDTQDFGSSLLKDKSYLMHRFPSVVIEEEFNYIINPLHTDMSLIKVIDVVDYSYDLRIKSN